MGVFKELYQYRELLKSNVKKDIRGKYKASFLGVLWSFINPLLQVLVYAIVFPYIMRVQTENYLIFLICGIIPWTWFVTSVNQGAGVFVYNSNLIKKVYFPRIILPISNVLAGLINFLISSVIIVIFVLFSGLGFSWHLILLPIIAIIQYIFTLAVVLLVSSINVYIRDTEYIINFILNMMFYATPVLYSYELFKGSNLIWLFRLNPMAHIINAYRDIFYVHVVPDLKGLFIICLVSMIMLLGSYLIYRKLEKGFAEQM